MASLCSLETSKTCHTQFLGKCFDPTTEEYKNDVALQFPGSDEPWEYHTVKVGPSRLRVPKFMKASGTEAGNYTKFNNLTFFTKEEYESHMKTKYSLGVDVPLIVKASSSGRWIGKDEGGSGVALIKYSLERETAMLSIPNISSISRERHFQSALNNLPNEFNTTTEPFFQQFFLKWGTHIVTQVSVGGYAMLECHVAYKLSSGYELGRISAEVEGYFRKLEYGANGEVAKRERNMEEMGLSNIKIYCRGGKSIEMFKSSTTPQFVKWLGTVDQHPIEIEHTIKLEPFFNLFDGQKSMALKSATEAYLENAAEKAKQVKERIEREQEKARRQQAERDRLKREREREERDRRSRPSKSFWSAMWDVLDFECNCPDHQ